MGTVGGAISCELWTDHGEIVGGVLDNNFSHIISNSTILFTMPENKYLNQKLALKPNKVCCSSLPCNN